MNSLVGKKGCKRVTTYETDDNDENDDGLSPITVMFLKTAISGFIQVSHPSTETVPISVFCWPMSVQVKRIITILPVLMRNLPCQQLRVKFRKRAIRPVFRL